jgi:surface protein
MIQIGINIAVKGAGISGPPPVLFTTEWTTTAPSENIELPYTGTGTYTGTIDWGDGSTSVNSVENRFHIYATAGTYTVIISGTCTGWDFNTVSGSTYITSVVNWGQLQLGTDNFGYNFSYCPNLNLSSVQGTLDLTGVTNLDGLFYNCASLTSVNNINSWDTSAITSMSEMFANCSLFNQALSFDTSAVTNMGSMFAGCSVFNQALSFDTSLVAIMNSMFQGCSVFNQPLSFDTSQVSYMNAMFYGCSVFNQALSFDTSVVTDMGGMFYGCSVFNQNIGNWDTSTVTSMFEMFRDAPAFNQDIGGWSVANVQGFSGFMLGKTPATFSTTNLNAIYNGWSTQAVQSSRTISFGTAKYTAAATAGRLILTGTKLWTITDGGL